LGKWCKKCETKEQKLEFTQKRKTKGDIKTDAIVVFFHEKTVWHLFSLSFPNTKEKKTIESKKIF
jgi:hypothetical protein